MAPVSWHVTLIDGRANYAAAERFPLAKRVITAKPGEALSYLTFDERTAVMLMTHNYNYDFAVLRQLLPFHLTYVGALGPKKRLHRMLDELKEDGIEVTPSQLESVYGPAGLDIGSENADEIALSILAEIQAVLKKSSAVSLRDKAFIHDRNSAQIIQQAL